MHIAHRHRFALLLERGNSLLNGGNISYAPRQLACSRDYYTLMQGLRAAASMW